MVEIIKPESQKRSDLFILLILILLIFIIAARTPLDSDLFWHLSAGRWMSENSKPLLMDPFSYTRAGQGWVNHSWLSEVLLYQLFHLGGWVALSIFVGLVAAISMLLLFIQIPGPAILKAFIIVLASIPASLVWSARPQIISLLFLAILSLILSKYNSENQKIIGWLPFLFCLWGNLHGGYALGIILFIVWLAGFWLDYILENRAFPKWGQRHYYLPILVGLLSCAALVVNPNTINILLISFKTVSVESLQNLVSEWASPDFHVLSQQSIIWLLAVVIISFAMNKQKIPSGDVITVILFLYMALVSRRNFGPFAIIAVPVVGRNLWSGLSKYPLKFMDREWSDRGIALPHKPLDPRISHVINVVIISGLMFAAVMKPTIVSYPALVKAYTRQLFPVTAYEQWTAVKSAQPGNLLSEYNWGGYLLWTDPTTPVFVDGRTDLYGDEIISEWISIVQSGPNSQELLEKYDIHAVLLMPDRPLLGALTKAGWVIQYQDSLAVLMMDTEK